MRCSRHSVRARALCVIAFALCACDAYDTALIEGANATKRAADAGVTRPTPRWITLPAEEDKEFAALSGASVSVALAPSAGDAAVAVPSCGNGALDPGEQCDVAITAGQVGACPDGCSGRESCTKRVLRGRDCSARCESIQIEDLTPNDDCCPAGATAATDNDCAAICDNGMVEHAEACDPIASCPKREACVSSDACVSARYSGDPAHCTASCELVPVRACMDGDGCCPPGCDHERDADCKPADPCNERCATPDAGAPAERSCEERHGSGVCERCDCTACPRELYDCAFSGDDISIPACEAIVACAAARHCTGIACFCGSANSQRCAQAPRGPCANEIRDAAGTSNVYQILALLAAGDNSVASASALLECRRNNCVSQCGL